MPTITAAEPVSAGAGVFYPGACYTFGEMRRRGFSGCMLRKMQRQGLPARRVGKIKVILGSDLLKFMEEAPIDTLGGPRR